MIECVIIIEIKLAKLHGMGGSGGNTFNNGIHWWFSVSLRVLGQKIFNNRLITACFVVV